MPLGPRRGICALSSATTHKWRLTHGTEPTCWARATTPKHRSRARGSRERRAGPALRCEVRADCSFWRETAMATPEKTEKNKMHFMRPGQDGWDFLAGLRNKQDSAHVARERCIKPVQDARKVLEARSARIAQHAIKRRRRGRALLPCVALASGLAGKQGAPACKNRPAGAPTRRDEHCLCHTGGRGASQVTPSVGLRV